MKLKDVAKTLNRSAVVIEKQAGEMLLLTELRKIEAELFLLMERYGVQSVDEMDRLIATGTVSEEKAGEDFFIVDYLMERKKSILSLLQRNHTHIDPWSATAYSRE